MDFNEARLHEATLSLHTPARICPHLSIALGDSKQHLSEVLFSALVGFSFLEKYSTYFVCKNLVNFKETRLDETTFNFHTHV